ncbi:WXG100 family type VII secretion target [Nocardia stercoris]|uniref:WXG100 family type VII secretion target n=1 Tax=Nocardia stercoris TaxID=2483361 RepID=UPI001319D8A0|nr:WXG100 family type VII secretion target [Nocardia stercoris]
MNGFSVDLGKLDDIVRQLENFSGFVSDQLEALGQRVGTVQEASWSGPSAQAYRTAHDNWAAAAAEFVQGVNDMSTAAALAHGHYSGAQNTNSKMLRG